MAGFKLSIDQTRGTFKIQGIVTGVGKDTFFVEKKTKNGKPWRNVNFGVRVSKDSVIYVGFNGMPQDKVFFSTNEKDADGNKPKPISVDWDKRNTFKKDKYSLIGMNVGLVKKVDEKGKEVNDIQHLVAFDAAKYVADHLKDQMSVFIKGNLEYSHFEAQNGEIAHSVKFVPNQISLLSKELDPSFGPDKDGKPYETIANFEQVLVYQDIEQDQNDKSKFVLSCNIVNYNTIETTTFVTTNEKLARNFKKMKPYTAIKVWGDLVSVRNVEEVASDDGWGGKNPMKVNAPYRVERLVTGADPDSQNFTEYTSEKMDQALAEIKKEESKKAEFESAGPAKSSGGDDWGKKNDSSDDDDDSDIPWGK